MCSAGIWVAVRDEDWGSYRERFVWVCQSELFFSVPVQEQLFRNEMSTERFLLTLRVQSSTIGGCRAIRIGKVLHLRCSSVLDFRGEKKENCFIAAWLFRCSDPGFFPENP